MTRTPLLLVLALLALAATPAAAAEGGLLDPSAGLIFWQSVVFLTVLVVLWKFAFPHILGAVEAREERIRELLAAAERDRSEAETLLAEQKRELEEVRGRAQEVIAEARTAAERMREEMLAETREEREAILSRVHRDLEMQVQRAMDQVRLDAVELAIAAASKLVERDLDAEDNRRMVREFLQQVESRGGAGVAAGV